jgi:hypothetical protein
MTVHTIRHLAYTYYKQQQHLATATNWIKSINEKLQAIMIVVGEAEDAKLIFFYDEPAHYLSPPTCHYCLFLSH